MLAWTMFPLSICPTPGENNVCLTLASGRESLAEDSNAIWAIVPKMAVTVATTATPLREGRGRHTLR
jgi:hypothetical protein